MVVFDKSAHRGLCEGLLSGVECRYHQPLAKGSASMEYHSSLTLLQRARAGDQAALELLIARYLPRMERWATGRLPHWARDMSDTQDLVQEALFQTFKRIEKFEPRGEGDLLAYLRKAILNRIREEFRRAKRRPERSEIDSHVEDEGWSPLEETIGREAVEWYERALGTLRGEESGMVVARIELGYTYQEVADSFGKPTSNAARMAVERAIVKLAKAMENDERDPRRR